MWVRRLHWGHHEIGMRLPSIEVHCFWLSKNMEMMGCITLRALISTHGGSKTVIAVMHRRVITWSFRICSCYTRSIFGFTPLVGVPFRLISPEPCDGDCRFFSIAFSHYDQKAGPAVQRCTIWRRMIEMVVFLRLKFWVSFKSLIQVILNLWVRAKSLKCHINSL